jgi:serine phosphatase RsbU (regulator of sigma subunit)
MSPRSPGQRRGELGFRVPIAVKFSLFIALVSILALSWQTAQALRSAGERLERAIDDRGIDLVSSIAALVSAESFSDAARRIELLEAVRKVGASNDTDILNVVIYDAARTPVALIREVEVTAGTPIPDERASAAGVTIRAHIASGSPVRTFSREIRGIRLEDQGLARAAGIVPEFVLGRVELFLSAREIERSKEALSADLWFSAWTSTVIATVAALLVGYFLARPIRALARDIRAIGLGNLDHRSTVATNDETGDLARALNRMAADLARAADDREEKQAIENELEIAAGIQRRLVPNRAPTIPGLDIELLYRPALEISGDYYDFIPVDERRWGVVVGDVAGKGIPGAIVMATVRTVLRGEARGEPSPARVLRRVQRLIAPDLDDGRFVTMLYMIIDTTTLEARVARAGHVPPWIYRSKTKTVDRTSGYGLAIGLDRGGAVFDSELHEDSLRLSPGDVIAAATDGLTEATDPRGVAFGEDRVTKLLEESSPRGVKVIRETLLESLESHVSDGARDDDTTLVLIRVRSDVRPAVRDIGIDPALLPEIMARSRPADSESSPGESPPPASGPNTTGGRGPR